MLNVEQRPQTSDQKLVNMKRIHRATVRISTSSDDLEAWFYEPGGKGPHPTVIMGHGLGAVKAGGLAPFAERFCAEDFAVLVIDYRQWGGSGGLPRDEVNVSRQQEDYRAAIDWATTAPSIDNSRIFIWGTSFSGMHALALAASETRIAGAIAQCPLVDGLAGSRTVRASRSAALFAVAVADRVGSLLGQAPLYVPSLVAPGQWGMFDTIDALYGKRLLAPREPVDWHNRIAARSILAIPFHRPIRRAAGIKIPLLLIIAESDTQAPVKPALTVAKRAPKAELRRSRGGHYDVYEGGSAFDEVIEWEVEFLRRHATAVPNP
jgi:pimeloyl-ACP methyl ester carboxylesterase